MANLYTVCIQRVLSLGYNFHRVATSTDAPRCTAVHDVLASNRPLFASLRSSDAAQRYPRINRRQLRRRSSSSKAQLGNSPARTSLATRRSQSVICPSCRHLVAASGRPAGSTSEHRLGVSAAPTSSSQLGGQNHQSLDQCNQQRDRFVFHCVPAAVYKDAALYNSRLANSGQSSLHVRGQLCRYRPLLQQLPTDSILRTGLITSSHTLSGCPVCTVSRTLQNCKH